MRKLIAIAAGVVVAVVAAALYIGGMGGTKLDSSYTLDVLNTGKEDVSITVSGALAEFDVQHGGAKTFVIDRQPQADDGKEREFTIKTAAESRTVRSKVEYGRHVVLDVSGKDCFVAADYGAQYRPKDFKLPEGARDITVLKIFRHKEIFLPATFDAAKGATDFTITVGLGEKLPDKISVSSRTSRSVQQVVRLIAVPCEIVDHERALYDYLHDH